MSAAFAATGMVVAFLAAGLFGLARPRDRFGAAGPLVCLGCVFCLAIACLSRDQMFEVTGPVGLAGVPIAFTLDSLSRWFLALIPIVGLPVCIYLPGYLAHMSGRAQPGPIWTALAVLLLSMAGVVMARNAVVFFACWELMSLSSFLLVATEHEKPSVRHAAFVYLGATRIGSAFLMAGIFWAHASTGSWDFANWLAPGRLAIGPGVLMLVGLLTKAGSWPFHLWLPLAHPVAPSPVSAVLSGVMIKTAVYVVFRLFVPAGPEAIGWSLVVLGGVSALWGILFGLLQHDMKRLLAYSSVENIGLILLAAGVSIVAHGAGLRLVSELALTAGLLHALNHAVFKSLLFLCAGTVQSRAHTVELDRLGGLIHRMPGTAASCLVGCAAICALPPLNGFVGEWLLYNGLFQMGASNAAGELRLTALLLIALLGLVGALALACFVKLFGIAFLGRARSGEARHAEEASRSMMVPCFFLAAGCLLLGLSGPMMWHTLERLGFVHFPDGWTLPIVPLTVLGAVLFFLVWALMERSAHGRPARRFDTWDCGFGALPPRTQYTATSFSQPIARMFGALYRYEMDIAVEGKGKKHFPTEVSVVARHEVYLESRVYEPALRSVLKLSGGLIMRLQAGSIHQYLLFMVVTLGFLLWLGGRF